MFRTGVIDAAGGITIDDPAPFATVGAAEPALLDPAVFRSELARRDEGGEAADYVLGGLGERFTRAALDQQFARLQTHVSTRRHANETISLLRSIAERTYAVEFSDQITLSERVLWPAMGAEQAGMDDARFVRFVDEDGSVTFYATYTAYSGSHISQQLLQDHRFPVLHFRADGRRAFPPCVGHAQSRDVPGVSEMIQPDGKKKLSRRVQV